MQRILDWFRAWRAIVQTAERVTQLEAEIKALRHEIGMVRTQRQPGGGILRF